MRRAAKQARGVLPGNPRGVVTHRRLLPGPELAERVAHVWWVSWQLDEPFVASTLPHPTVHLIFEPGAAAIVHGVPTARFDRRLTGAGFVVGVKFRPGGFSGLAGGPVSALKGRGVPARTLLHGVGRVERLVASASSLEACMSAVEPWLSRLAPLSVEARRVRDLVERCEVDRTLVRVEQLARLVEVDVRTLQRLFREHVGTSPKWVLQRYRLHEAAGRLKLPSAPPLATLADELGFADQAHFTREFTRVVGRTPRQLARSVGRS